MVYFCLQNRKYERLMNNLRNVGGDMPQNQNAEEYRIHRMLEIMKEMMIDQKWRHASRLERVLEEELAAYICKLFDIQEMSFDKCIAQKDQKISELYERLYIEHENCCNSLDFVYEDDKEVRKIVQECNVYCFFFLEELIRHIEKFYGEIDWMFQLPDLSKFDEME